MFMKKSILTTCLLAGAMLFGTSFTLAEVIFEDNFDNQPDWTTGMYSSKQVQRAKDGDIIPNGYYSTRQEANWTPSTGHPDRHEVIEILASNANKARGGEGKSFVAWRKAYDAGWKNWASESMLVKYFPEGHDAIYVEFWISFDPNWTREYVSGRRAATSKIFRVSSWNGNGSEYSAFNPPNLGPIALWDHSLNDYGMRNTLAFRGGPAGSNYKFAREDIPSVGGNIIPGSLGDLNLNYTSSLAGMGPNGSDPVIKDQLNGGFITPRSPTVTNHGQIFGVGTTWTKLAFYVRMNSAPGAKDGVFKQWLNDEQIFTANDIPWIRPSEVPYENVKWNLVAIGGNDFFHTYPNSERHEEWYSIDDLVIRTDIPDYVNSDAYVAPPNPPAYFDVE